jgi:hypothetical protein
MAATHEYPFRTIEKFRDYRSQANACERKGHAGYRWSVSSGGYGFYGRVCHGCRRVLRWCWGEEPEASVNKPVNPKEEKEEKK